jgi:hypothetical protein
MNYVRRSRRAVAITACAAVAVAIVPAVAQAASAPSVRVIRSARQVHLRAIGHRTPLDLGVFVASVGGDFELRVSRSNTARPSTCARSIPGPGRSFGPSPARRLRIGTGSPTSSRSDFERLTAGSSRSGDSHSAPTAPTGSGSATPDRSNPGTRRFADHPITSVSAFHSRRQWSGASTASGRFAH